MKKVLISSAVAVLLLVGCTDEKPKEQESQATKVTQETTKKVEETQAKDEQTIQETVAKTAEDIKNKVSNTTSEVVEEASKTVEQASKTVEETVPEVKKSVNEAVEETQKTMNNVKKQANDAIAAATGSSTEEKSIDAKALYASCATCHGQKAEKKALNASQVIKGWDKEKLIKALNGYKDGSYGRAMKGVMKGQVATKSQAEIEALAQYISEM